MGKLTTIKKETGEKLRRFVDLRLGSLGKGLGYDDIIDWLLEIANKKGEKNRQ